MTKKCTLNQRTENGNNKLLREIRETTDRSH